MTFQSVVRRLDWLRSRLGRRHRDQDKGVDHLVLECHEIYMENGDFE